jgi:putative hemolysin
LKAENNNMKKKEIILLVLFALLILSFSALVFVLNSIVVDSEESNYKLANPAAVYCTENGFKYDIRANDLGQYGVCINPQTGAECDEWSLYNRECEL